jgi:uncharacterized membrane protein YtjA (UPF0391 family)
VAGAIPTPATTSPEAWRLQEDYRMLGWALVFLVIALVAALLGFGGIAGTAAGIAKILFVVFLVLFGIGVVMHLARGRTPPL